MPSLPVSLVQGVGSLVPPSDLPWAPPSLPLEGNMVHKGLSCSCENLELMRFECHAFFSCFGNQKPFRSIEDSLGQLASASESNAEAQAYKFQMRNRCLNTRVPA
jgi:hypothetical protein